MTFLFRNANPSSGLRPFASAAAAAVSNIHDIAPPFPPDSLRSLRQSPPLLATDRAGGTFHLRCSPLSLPRSPVSCPHRRFHRPYYQAPTILPPPYLSSHLPPSLPLLLKPTRVFSSSSESDSESDNSISPPPPPPPPNSNDVDRICKVIDELFSSDRNMEVVLDEIGVQIESSLVVAVLDRFRHAHRPAYRFFRWAAARPGFLHDSTTCNKMLSVLGKTRQFETMVALLEEMGKDAALLSMDAFKISVKAFAAAREMKKCIGIFKLIKKYDFHVGLDTFNCLIDALSKAKLAKEAQQLLDKMKDQYHPDIHTYTALLYGFCKIKDLAEAGRLWNEILDSGFKPDIVSHNTMLEGLIRGHRRSEAIKLLELMKAKGPKPNTRTYTILIQDLCKAGKMEQAVSCFDEMLAACCSPDVATYTCLIVGFGNARQMAKVSSLLAEMSQKGCPPDARTYNALIKLLTNRNMPDDAVRIYKKMIKNGFEPTIHTYNMLMKSYFHGNNYKMGCAVWEEMLGKGICPDVNSFTVFIGGHIRHGRPEEAYKYIEEMINKGMSVPQVDYNKLAADFSRAGRPDVLSELAQKMNFTGKFDASNTLNYWSERMKKRVKRRGPCQSGRGLV
ncbi:pentatricopeptide repeat-containing protein At3g62470, mitochondrial-like [Phalaenopsis equestris]|uniref:pentatricopeptide repeat-containing protein At3g62470, mitochondrial-like n=1 Tax=Phalaenopsis equestris TaxID=78828 RepID=UPI0009E416AA|nr:pentatricopeptide repeat-containing protein At3g62470, mitochondrial-like [Phalaenopsis equestris]